MYQYNLGLFFKSICHLYAKKICIKYQDSESSYEKADLDSDMLAAALCQQGLRRGDVIVILNSKEYASYSLMLACLKIGVIYTNIDPDIPVERFKHILQICSPVKIFTDHPCSSVLTDYCSISKICIDDINSLRVDASYDFKEAHKRCCDIDGEAIAYIMFTSGSTGKPKGVAITHQNLIHFIHWAVTAYAVTSDDVFTNINPMYFDNSVFDFYTALFSGACLVPINKSIVSAPDKLIRYIESMSCTIWFSVPSLLMYLKTMRVLQLSSLGTLRLVIFGGEGYPKSELKKVYDLYSPRITFVNVYGPTECTCICSSYIISDDDFVDMKSLPPLGRLNPNFSYLILNEHGEIDGSGELCLFGPNVGRGYYHHAEAGNQAFCEYSDYGYYRSRMYKTGDLVQLKNGLLHFIGRKDNQIKHMGYRIELQEIEIAIGIVPGVNQVAVIYEKSNAAYGKIVAYVASINALDSQDIREHLKSTLPSYMIPNKIVMLEQLPKNANGKVDRIALLDQVL